MTLLAEAPTFCFLCLNGQNSPQGLLPLPLIPPTNPALSVPFVLTPSSLVSSFSDNTLIQPYITLSLMVWKNLCEYPPCPAFPPRVPAVVACGQVTLTYKPKFPAISPCNPSSAVKSSPNSDLFQTHHYWISLSSQLRVPVLLPTRRASPASTPQASRFHHGL